MIANEKEMNNIANDSLSAVFHEHFCLLGLFNERSSADSLFHKENAKLYIFYFEQRQVFIYTSHWVIQTYLLTKDL